jgi:4-hydroxy-2-oxoheptanedioate aldolase
MIDFSQMVHMLQGISSTDTVPLVRVPRNEPGIIGKSLDAGAWGVIVPMVNNRREAEAAVAACRYAPVGHPQLRTAAGQLLRRTRLLLPGQRRGAVHRDDRDPKEAVENVDDIVSVPGVDAVYMGPADLSITLGLPPAPDQSDPSFTDALEKVVDACRRHDVVPGAAGNASTAVKRIEQGFRLVEVASDGGLAGGGRRRRPGPGPTGGPDRPAGSAYL